jgi:transposase InsO family protein
MTRISFDSIGVLTEDKEWGFNHVLVVIDNFTRWIELYPTRGVTAVEAARVLLDHSGRYGIASEWVSDRGTQFANEVIEALSTLLGSEHCFTLPHSKEENAIVERANKEVM